MPGPAAMQLPPSATLADAPALLQQWRQSLASGSGPVKVDASGLQNFDTSALALLMHAHRLARAAGRPFSVVGAPPKLAQLAQLYGIEELLSLSSPSAPVPGAGAA
jgi:phospholipid transport system transporter-binding protein